MPSSGSKSTNRATYPSALSQSSTFSVGTRSLELWLTKSDVMATSVPVWGPNAAPSASLAGWQDEFDALRAAGIAVLRGDHVHHLVQEELMAGIGALVVAWFNAAWILWRHPLAGERVGIHDAAPEIVGAPR